jgi:hypothetical protein
MANPLDPDNFINIVVPVKPLPRWEDFEKTPLTEMTCRRAQLAVEELREHAKRTREYYEYFEEGVKVRAYYGSAGAALAEAERIRKNINANVNYNFCPSYWYVT